MPFCVFLFAFTAKQRKEEEERGCTWRRVESTDERWPWLCIIWWWLRPRLWGFHVTLAPSQLPFPPLNPQKCSCTFSCCPVPSWKIWTMCCPLHFASMTRGTIPWSIRFHHLFMFINMELPLLCLIQPRLTHKWSCSICWLTQLQWRKHHNCCDLSFAGSFFIKCCSCQNGRYSIAVISVVT